MLTSGALHCTYMLDGMNINVFCNLRFVCEYFVVCCAVCDARGWNERVEECTGMVKDVNIIGKLQYIKCISLANFIMFA